MFAALSLSIRQVIPPILLSGNAEKGQKHPLVWTTVIQIFLERKPYVPYNEEMRASEVLGSQWFGRMEIQNFLELKRYVAFHATKK